MKAALLHLGLAICTTAAIAAQDAGNDSEARQMKGRVASFVCSSLPAGLENPVTVLVGGEISEVILSKLSPSAPVKIPTDGIVRIVRASENPQNPEKPEYLTLAQATIPETVSQAVIILVPVAENPNGLLFQTKVLDLDAIKGGDSLFLNMTNLKIGVELGRSNLIIEPGKMETLNALGSSPSVTLPIRLSYFHPERSEWSMITASTVALYSTRRELCIFSWDVRFNRVDFESITLPTL